MERQRVRIGDTSDAEWLPSEALEDPGAMDDWRWVCRNQKNDVQRIAKAVREVGLRCTYTDAATLWAAHSGVDCAGWLILPDESDQIFRCVSPHIDNDVPHAPRCVMTTETAIKERPILFKGEMVRAILNGRKTQTRRVVKPPHKGWLCDWDNAKPEQWSIDGENPLTGTSAGEQYLKVPARHPDDSDECLAPQRVTCPYGSPGERLWVRERFHWDEVGTDVSYHADYTAEEIADAFAGERWKPSIYMPRTASRINLEITDVRVERLQEISEEDAKAEGVTKLAEGMIEPFSQPVKRIELTYRDWFQHLWQSINGEDSWTANPWVWVVEFKRIED